MTMKLEGRDTVTKGLKEMVKGVQSDLNAKVMQAGERAARAAVSSMKDTIATTPSGYVPGKGNRILTGNMWSRVESKVRRSGNKVTIEYGWFGLKRDEAYIYTQENGPLPIGGGMLALVRATGDISRSLNKDGIEARVGL